MQKTGTFSIALLLAATMLLSTGCRGPWSKGWKPKDMLRTPWSKDEDQVETPQRVVGTWTDAVMHQGGKTPQRGFGGRLIFYGKDNEKPVLVDGELVIYAFDESNREVTNNKPTRRYVFPPDQMARRMSKNEMGPSYSFWLPWDDAGGPQTDVSLIARFQPTDGPIVMGEQTRHLLPGEARLNTQIVNNTPPRLPDGVPMRPATTTLADLAAQAQAQSQAQALAGNGQVQLASYDAIAGGTQPIQQPATAPEPERRMTTTSISLPENFRLQNGGPTPSATRDIPLANDRFAMPQSPPPNYAAVAAPISVPQPGFSNYQPTAGSPQQLSQVPVGYPTFMTPPQSPLGNGFVAPLGPPQSTRQPTPSSVGQISAPPPAPMMQGQPPIDDGRRLGDGQLSAWGGTGGLNGFASATVIWFSTDITPGSSDTSFSITSRWLSLAATPRSTTVSPTTSTFGDRDLAAGEQFLEPAANRSADRGGLHLWAIEGDVEPHSHGERRVLFLRRVAIAIAAAHVAVHLLKELVRVAAELIEDRRHLAADRGRRSLGYLAGSCPACFVRSRLCRRARSCRSRSCRFPSRCR